MARPHSYNAPQGKIPKAITTRESRKAHKPKTHPCNWPDCDKAFGRRADMVRHRRAYHEKIRPYKCPYQECPKRFAQSSSLSTHVNTHTRAKPFVCPCGKRFGDASSCTRHYREQHDGKKFFCPWCSTSNKRRAEFRKHLIEHRVPNAKKLDLDVFWLPEQYTVDDLETLPQFHGQGMTGLEMRRKTPGCRKATRARSSTRILSDPALICMDRASSFDSLASTPALSPAVSPTPSTEEDNVESYHMDPSQFDFSGNVLGVQFGTESQDMYLSPLSNFSPTLSAVAEGTGSYASQGTGYVHTHTNQVFYAPGDDKSYMDPQLLGAAAFTGNDLYEYHDMTLNLPLAQNQVFQPELHMNYMTPISRLGRSSHAQASGWGQLR